MRRENRVWYQFWGLIERAISVTTSLWALFSVMLRDLLTIARTRAAVTSWPGHRLVSHTAKLYEPMIACSAVCELAVLKALNLKAMLCGLSVGARELRVCCCSHLEFKSDWLCWWLTNLAFSQKANYQTVGLTLPYKNCQSCAVHSIEGVKVFGLM